jgi:3-(3-hydroxy-phenyl)propionate hydroxylase
MSPKKIDTSVLIVGGGPTGLALANALGIRGIDVVLVEREPGVAELPRAVSIDDEAMRFMQSIGLQKETEAVVFPGTGTKYYSRKGKPLIYARGPARQRYGHPIKNPMDHPEFQQVLLDGARRFENVVIRHETDCTGFTEDEDGITAEIRSASGDEKIRCRFLIGCEGGNSLSRNLIGEEPMSGSVFEERWLVVDTVNDPNDQRYAMHHGDPRRPHIVIVGREGRCRYEFLVHNDEDPAPGDEQFELAAKLCAPFRSLEPEDVVRCTIYKFYALVADNWSKGRVYLAGDACHMMPPFAGQGLNSGLRDAVNLSWKVAAVLQGRVGEELLQTYQSERRPHVSAMVKLSMRMGSITMTLSKPKAALRDWIVQTGQALPGFRKFLREMKFKPPAFYGDGFFVPAQPPEDGTTGAMVFQPRVLTESGEVVLLDSVTGSEFALLAIDLEPEALVALKAPVWDRLDPKRVLVRFDDLLPKRGTHFASVADADGLLEGQLGHLRGQLVLVRPDRFIAGSFKPADEEAFAASLEAMLGAAEAAATPVAKVA